MTSDVKGSKKALVKWLGDPDDGVLEVVDASWMVNFNADAWKALPEDKRPESDVIKYKKEQLPESGHYSSFDAKINHVSSKQKTLNDLKALMEAEQKKKEQAEQRNKDEAKRKSEELNNRPPKKLKDGQGLTEDGASSSNESDDIRPEKRSTVDNHKEKSSESSDSSSDDEPTSTKKDPKEKVETDSHTMNKLKKKAKKASKENRKTLTKKGKKGTKDGSKPEGEKVSIFKGSPYLVDAVQYNHFKQQGCQPFVVAMLHQVFRTKVLVVSNIRGGKSKNDPDGHIRRWALDKSKRLAIVGAARALFPMYDKSRIHTFMTGNINSIRLKLKRKGKLAAIEEKGKEAMKGVPYCVSDDDSSSSDDDSSDNNEETLD